MQETNKNCHTNLLKFKEIARNHNFQIYDIIESFLDYTEYAMKMFLILSLLNLLVYEKQQAYKRLKLVYF